MSASIKSIATAIARIVFGLIYMVFSINFFFNFLPAPPPQQGAVAAFVGGLNQSGYFFPLLKGIEIIAGLLLLSGHFVSLALIVPAPVSIHVLLVHTILAPEAAPLGIIIL